MNAGINAEARKGDKGSSATVKALESSRDAMDVMAAIDPSGIASTISAYSYLKCSAYGAPPKVEKSYDAITVIVDGNKPYNPSASASASASNGSKCRPVVRIRKMKGTRRNRDYYIWANKCKRLGAGSSCTSRSEKYGSGGRCEIYKPKVKVAPGSKCRPVVRIRKMKGTRRNRDYYIWANKCKRLGAGSSCTSRSEKYGSGGRCEIYKPSTKKVYASKGKKYCSSYKSHKRYNTRNVRKCQSYCNKQSGCNAITVGKDCVAYNGCKMSTKNQKWSWILQRGQKGKKSVTGGWNYWTKSVRRERRRYSQRYYYKGRKYCKSSKSHKRYKTRNVKTCQMYCNRYRGCNAIGVGKDCVVYKGCKIGRKVQNWRWNIAGVTAIPTKRGYYHTWQQVR
jgi:hypothetical protein